MEHASGHLEPGLPREASIYQRDDDSETFQVTEWLIGFWLFEPNREKLWSYEEDHLARMTEALDAHFEKSLLQNSKHRDTFFKPNGAAPPSVSKRW